MKRIYLLISLLTCVVLCSRSQVSTQNYIRTRTHLSESGTQYLDQIQYIDGLGRPFQTVHKGITPAKTHLTTLQEYDALSRESNLWLPHVSSAEYTDPALLKTQVPATYSADGRPYSQLRYEASPLNRVIETYGPGQAWITRPVRTDYLSNTTDGQLACKFYKISSTGTLTTAGNYPANELYVVRSTDEDTKLCYQFTDKLGQLLLTRQVNGTQTHDTYYVYDDSGRLRFVLSPMYQETANLHLYAYQYTYDGRGRCTQKKLPGCDPIRYVYDRADRIIFSQDGNQQAKAVKEWSFYLYDAFGREVLRGTCTNTNTASVASTLVTTSFVATNTGIGNSGYTSSFALVNPVVERICYYDTYNFRSLTGFTSATDFPTTTVSAKGMLTAQVHIPAGTTTRLCEAFYYDAKGRRVNHVAANHLGGYDKTGATYTFTGLPLTVTKTHTASGKTTLAEVYTYTYDHAERLTKLTHKLNSNAAVTLAEYTYDNLGRMLTRKNHGLASTQTTHAYNIRSWLTGLTSTLFTQNLYYNTGSGTPAYNGNISSMTWKAGTETPTRGYKFTYDGLDRLTAATYGEGTAISTNPNRFDEKVTLYDKNGNIKKLERRGKTSTTAYGVIDNLTFTHSGNQLLNVSDAATDPTYAGNFNFVDGNKAAGTEYIWDKNGNMVQDYNKQIANISYNSLNLPVKLQFRQGHTAEYLYDASGVKRQVKHTTTNQNLSVGWGSFKEITAAQKASEKVTDYCGGVIYENGVLKMILTPEGYITLSGTTPTYHYYLRDHLGNNRVVVSQSGTVMQVNHYYPFGGVFGGGTATSTQPYKYNDKELDRTNGLDLYDYSARFMDAALGQFTTVDPMAEKYYSISPYAYVGNNPVRKLDPDGRDEYEFNGKQWVKISDIGRSMGLNFFHMGVTNADGKEITNIMDQEGNWAEMSGGREILKEAQIRGEDVNWKTITDEFTNGTGPEKSMFEGNNPANQAIQEHYLYQNAVSEFEGLEKDNAYIKVNWGPKDVIKTGTKNKQAQMMGSYSVSFYKIGDKTLSFIYDSKSKTSLFYHLPVTNKDRQQGGSNRLKTTRQLYMFFNQ
ncbi:MAG: RHS repeat-associated core domain-containing protein [Bacteroides sp.]|nr:RHS repeat-associated core domain-containing protein [Bacteroides sp.]